MRLIKITEIQMCNALYPLFLHVKFSIGLLLVLIFGIPSAVLSQDDSEPRRGSKVIDDTTKQIYGPRTSRYFFEDDVFLNREIFYQVDTLIRDFHRFNDVQRNENMYQDLGVIGTAIRPIYYEVPEAIGVSSGFNGYDVYWNREQIKYWDTKSPYSNMLVILGGGGRSITRATYSRNISPRWNFGLTYRGMFIDKQVSRQGKGDRNVRGQYYDFFTTYQSKDSTYRVFANFRRNNHEVAEFGGVRNDVPFNFQYTDYFLKTSQPWLTEAINRELRMNIHLYHQYKIGTGLQVYHKFDRFRQGNRFTDSRSSEPDYDYIEIDSAVSNDKVKFHSLRNEFGVKGSLAKLFYNGYFAIRDYEMNYNYDTLLDGRSHNKWKGTESYLGGRVALKLDSLIDFVGWAEIILPNGNYRIDASFRSKWFEASLKQVQYAPSFLQLYYRGSHDFWKNNWNSDNLKNFSNINTTRLSGFVHYTTSVLNLSPGVSFTRVGNYIFFKRVIPDDGIDRVDPDTNEMGTDVVPFQSRGEQIIFSPMMNLGFTFFRHLHLRGNAIYTKLLQDADDAFQIPELFVNGQISYENIFFNGNMDMHGGVDVHWKSSYYALAYDVPTGQFYVQGDPALAGFNDQGGRNFSGDFGSEDPADGRFLTPALPGQPNLPILDVFFSMKVKRARIFFKYNNLFQAITGKGYFATPQYPGQRNSIDFGFDWSFYD
jgi:hypothetical protein